LLGQGLAGDEFSGAELAQDVQQAGRNG
jgi:hypothetical protein